MYCASNQLIFSILSFIECNNSCDNIIFDWYMLSICCLLWRISPGDQFPLLRARTCAKCTCNNIKSLVLSYVSPLLHSILHYVWHNHTLLQCHSCSSHQIYATVEIQQLLCTHQQLLDLSVLEWSGDHSAAHWVWKTSALNICNNFSSEMWVMLLQELMERMWK